MALSGVQRSFLTIFLILLLGGSVLYSEMKKRGGDNGEVEDDPADQTSLSVFAANLNVPWSLAFLSDGSLLAAERGGSLKIFKNDSPEPMTVNVPGVSETGEGGLLGVALHPDFEKNKFIYLYFTARNEGIVVNKVVRYVFDNNALTQNQVIIDDIPGGTIHNGGRIAFGPDKKLYITTGDAGESDNAQEIKSFSGKILRLEDNGVIPEDNPFESEIYSYGHRNPQGLAWDEEGRLWSIEHGRSGVQSGFDEINLIVRGGNYGWPLIQGDQKREDIISPILHSGATTTWAPADLVIIGDKLYFTGLRGRTLYEVSILPDGRLGGFTEHFQNKYGRLRAMTKGANNEIYFGTSNKDGRGRPAKDDDKILKLEF